MQNLLLNEKEFVHVHDLQFRSFETHTHLRCPTPQSEVAEVIQQFPPYIYYSVIPLTLAGRCKENVTDFSDPDWATWKDSPLFSSCPYIKSVCDSLQCRTTNVRLLRLEPGADVREHTDPQLDLALQNQVRLHVPIFVDPQVEFRLNGTPVPLQPGELWYLRLSDPHSVHNRSETERIQLSIDVVVNEWIEEQIVVGHQ